MQWSALESQRRQATESLSRLRSSAALGAQSEPVSQTEMQRLFLMDGGAGDSKR